MIVLAYYSHCTHVVTNHHMPRNHDYVFYVTQPHLDERKFSFAVRTVQYWNGQLNAIENATAVSQCGALLHTINLMRFMRYRALYDQ